MSKENNIPSKSRVIYINTINQDSEKEIITQLMRYDMENVLLPIRIIVNTYGGLVHSMFAIYDAIRTCTAPIITIGIGKIMSAGVLLLASGKKGDRRISSNTTVMIHEISAWKSGKVFELENDVKESRRLQNLLEKSLSKETGQRIKDIRKIMNKHKSVYITAHRAKKYGIVDKVIK